MGTEGFYAVGCSIFLTVNANFLTMDGDDSAMSGFQGGVSGRSREKAPQKSLGIMLCVMDEIPCTGQKGMARGAEQLGIGCRSAAD